MGLELYVINGLLQYTHTIRTSAVGDSQRGVVNG